MAEIVTDIVERVKEHVSDEELIDVNLNDIIDEVTQDFIDQLDE